MQAHVGDYFKEVIVNQSLAMKDFAGLYKTTPSHLSEILGKKDLNTSIIRKFETILDMDFRLVTGFEKANVNEQAAQYARVRTDLGGRPPEFKHKQTPDSILRVSTNTEVLMKEIEGLKALLASKDQIIKSKDDLIQTLIANKV